ncbi:MAG TPA: glycerophosphodiester phosphodiesterase family protein [Anaerolineae bacterium]|nr:glycerophosphodiester phosphodiesterase family protein [Anaerolineae bacterium]HQH37198.1 glycerophosphodiester phosphodiesterase family protein [Anaerolineae bacterium]
MNNIPISLTRLLNVSQNPADRALAARYAPILRFDAREPFLPLAAGYTIFRETAASPSFCRGHRIDLAPPNGPCAAFALEYAIWWDWDIGHLYELEHVWVYVNADGHVVRAEASWHGDFRAIPVDGSAATLDQNSRQTDGNKNRLDPLNLLAKLEGDHLVIFSEPGKHAFAPTPAWFKERCAEFKRSVTSDLAGIEGVLLAVYIQKHVQPTPLKTRLVHTYLAQRAFEPSWDFSLTFSITPEMLVPWEALRDWMPGRVNAILDQLAREIPPSKYRFLRIGHRGARAHAPDNTLLGIRTAAALKADMVEFDVQCTADGHVVLAHDAYLIDGDGRAWPIRRSTLEQLRALDLGQGEHIPTFAEALQVCSEENLGAYIEIKDGAAIEAVITTLRDELYAEYCILAAFRPDWLATVKDIEPRLMTSILFNAPAVDAVKLAQSVKATFVHPCWERCSHPSALLTPEWISRVRAANLGIVCWHEERPAEIAALRQLGVDAICSDAPECLLEC